MLPSEYKEATALSRAFSKRSLADSQKLYAYINRAVSEANDVEHPQSQRSIDFIIKLYEPYIKKVSTSVYMKLRTHYAFEDIFQEITVIFLKLLYRYKEKKSSFSYYMYNFLPQYVKLWVNQQNKVSWSSVDHTILENTINPMFEFFDVADYYHAAMLEEECIKFIKERSLKFARSNTVFEVCTNYFLGNQTCSEISDNLNISYHAVYEVINKIKKELYEFLKTSKFYDSDLIGPPK